MVSEEQIMQILGLGWERFVDMVVVPIENPEMLWSVTPLIIAVLFMTLYFGRYKQEELGWNTAFGNTMVFLFVAINLIKEMYYDAGITSIGGLLDNPFYLFLSLGLAGTSFLLMMITYFHKIPQKIAFFMFSAPPLNVSIYVIMTMIYADVPADAITLLAAVILLIFILILTILLKITVYTLIGYHEELAVKMKGGIPSQDQKVERKKRHKPVDDTGAKLKVKKEED